MSARARIFVFALAAIGVVYWCFNGLILEHRGPYYSAPITENTFWLARPVRLALHRPPPKDVPGQMHWRTLAPGFEVADLPVLVGREEVERIFLARIDPAQFRFELHNDTANRTNLDGWMQRTRAALVVNASYFDMSAGPATPVIIDGKAGGPSDYSASHGAFVSSLARTQIADLAGADWHAAFAGAHTALVSYPLLIAPDGTSRTARDAGWLANRSFLGEDRDGKIIIGTTKSAFFTLPRLADFLKRAPLNLRMALNLDGGPVACQGVALGGYRRMSYGHWEVQVDANGSAHLLPGGVPLLNLRHETMPFVLAVYPRRDVVER
ncbi:MAG: phosphodiester glycosidase family protein [Terricaulis sp.]